jgi:hypothetical protein
MPSPFTISRFPGYRLDQDPTELGFDGALDILNVDYTNPGMPELRPGTYRFLHTPGNTDLYGRIVVPPELGNGAELVFAARGSSTGCVWDALEVSTGEIIDTSTPSGTLATVAVAAALDIAAYGTPDESTFFATTSTLAHSVMEQFDTDTLQWSTPVYTGTQPEGSCVGVTPWDNRLVNGGGANDDFQSTLYFSDEGDPLTFPADNFLQLTPGDGENIRRIVVWSNRMFVFKQSKFFVFWGTTVGSSGTPEFQYDTIYGEGVHLGNCVATLRDGVYFANRNGIFRTTGGAPQRVSDPVQPLWDYNGSSVAVPPWNPYVDMDDMSYGESNTKVVSLTASGDGDKLMLGGNGARALIYHPHEDWWSIWELPEMSGASQFYGAAGFGSNFIYSCTFSLRELMVIQGHAEDNVWTGNGTTYLDDQCNEVQSVIATGGTAGNFTLQFDNGTSTQTTGNINYNATAANVQTALEALSTVDSGDVNCSGGPLPNTAVNIEFTGQYLRTALAQMTIGTENVTNGNAAVSTLRNGSSGDVVSAYWTSGASYLGDDSEKVIRDALVTSTGGTVGLALSTDLAAFPTAVECTFTGTETLRFRGPGTNVSGHTVAMKVTNDTASETASRFNINRVTLLARGARPSGLDSGR